MAGISALMTNTGWSTTSTTYVALGAPISLSRVIGTSGQAIVQIAVDGGVSGGGSSTSYCDISFTYTGGPSVGTYLMHTDKGSTDNLASDFFVLNGFTPGNNITFQLYYRNLSGGTCTINDVSFMVMSP